MNTGTPSASLQSYAILVEGRLDACWSEWFGGLTVTPGGADRDDTVLFGPVADQSALQGILSQIGSLGLTLIAVYRLDAEAEPRGAQEPGSTNPSESDITREE